MRSATAWFKLAALFALAALVFAIANPRTVQALAATLVQVANTAANPVPVAGTIDVSSLPAVQLASGQAIADSSGRQGIMLHNQFSVPSGPGVIVLEAREHARGLNGPFVVPAGKRLVIQDVSLLVFISQGTPILSSGLVLQTLGGNNTVFEGRLEVPLTFRGSSTVLVGGQDKYSAEAHVTAYVDAGSSVDVSVARESINGALTVSYTIIGYLVDCGAEGCLPQP